MTDRHCPYSGMEVATRIDRSLPVECPVCGAIRTIPAPSVWPDAFRYPRHKQADFVQMHRRWKRVNGSWRIVEQ